MKPRRTWRDTTGWRLGICCSDGREYPTLNPPDKPRKPRRAPRVEPDVAVGPFVVRCFYATDRPFDPPRKLGYVLMHPETGSTWSDVVFTTVAGAAAFAERVAAAFNWSAEAA